MPCVERPAGQSKFPRSVRLSSYERGNLPEYHSLPGQINEEDYSWAAVPDGQIGDYPDQPRGVNLE